MTKTIILDVRTPEEFAEGAIHGAINIPVQILGERLGEMGSKENRIVVYCRSGKRSAMAKAMLLEAGFISVEDVASMDGYRAKYGG